MPWRRLWRWHPAPEGDSETPDFYLLHMKVDSHHDRNRRIEKLLDVCKMLVVDFLTLLFFILALMSR